MFSKKGHRVTVVHTQKRRIMRGTYLFIILVPFLLFAQKTISIGVLSDYRDSKWNKQAISFMQTEISRIVGPSKKVTFEDRYQLRSSSDEVENNKKYHKLTKKCDLVFLVGPASVYTVVKNMKFPVPTIALGVFDAKLQTIPITKEGTSGVKNFTYILPNQTIETEAEEFRKLIEFQHLTIIYDRNSFQYIKEEDVVKRMRSDFQDSLLKVTLIPLDTSIMEVCQGIPNSSDAVIVSVPLGAAQTDIKYLADYLIDKQIPSFSMNGAHVMQGIMAAFAPEQDYSGMLFRKCAIMVDELLNGRKAEDMLVGIEMKKEIILNIRTMRNIKFSPPFHILLNSNLVEDGMADLSDTLTLQSVIEKGIENNLNIKISKEDLKLSEEEISNSISDYLPDVSFAATAVRIDEQRASPLTGQAEKTLKGTVALQQLLFAESAFANIRIQKYLAEAKKYATMQDINDIILDVSSAYINILQLKSLVDINKENRDVIKKNLGLSESGVKLGSISSSDVYRWKSEYATAQQRLLESQSNLVIAHLHLNTLLNLPLKGFYAIADLALGATTEDLYEDFSDDLLVKYLTSTEDLETLSQFLIMEAKAQHPAHKQLEVNRAVIDRTQLMKKRQYYIPTLALQGQVDHVWSRGGKASEPLPGSDFEDLSWNIGVSLNYPLFKQNKRAVELQKTNVQKQQIQLQQESLTDNISMGVAMETVRLLSSITNTYFTKISTDNAIKNYELIQANYKQGLIPITTMIDAQNAALNAKMNHTLAVYDFLQTHFNLEHKMGRFLIASSPKEKAAFQKRIDDYFQQQKDRKYDTK